MFDYAAELAAVNYQRIVVQLRAVKRHPFRPSYFIPSSDVGSKPLKHEIIIFLGCCDVELSRIVSPTSRTAAGKLRMGFPMVRLWTVDLRPFSMHRGFRNGSDPILRF
jgi:hypothetical protein